MHTAKNKIAKEFKEKEKSVQMEQRIKISRAEARFRVQKMTSREELLNGVMADAVQALQSVTEDKAKYQVMLRDLIVQGLIKLNEAKVEVVVRECDADVAKKVKNEAAKIYGEIILRTTGQTATTVLEVNTGGAHLPPAADGSGKKSCAGGVKLTASNGRIICDNTLDSRLAVAFDQLMPEIRSKLFSTRV